MLQKNVIKHFLSLSSFTALNHGSRIVLTLCLARLLTTEEFGTFAALLALCEILLLPASMGFSSSLMRLSYPLYKNQQHDLLQGLKRVYLSAACLFGAIFVACVVLGFHYVTPHQTAKEHLPYLLLLVPIGAVMQSQAAFLIALQQPKLGLFTQQCLFELLTSLFCLAFFWLFGALSLVEICLMLFASLSCVVLYQFMQIKKLLQPASAHYQTKYWCKSSLLMLASGAGTVLVAKLDVLLVHHWFGAQGVSVFFPAVVIAGLLTILANAASQYLKPILMDDHSNHLEIGELMRVLWCFNSLAIVALAVLAEPLLSLYGETQLQQGLQLLWLLLVAQLLLPARVLASNVIKLIGNPLHNLYVLLFATSITVILAFILKTNMGLTGVAIAFSLGFILGAVCRLLLITTVMKFPLKVVLGNINPTNNTQYL